VCHWLFITKLFVSYSFFHSFIHIFIAVCKVHYVENVESEVLEAVARWSVIGKMVSFKVALKAVE